MVPISTVSEAHAIVPLSHGALPQAKNLMALLNSFTKGGNAEHFHGKQEVCNPKCCVCDTMFFI